MHVCVSTCNLGTRGRKDAEYRWVLAVIDCNYYKAGGYQVQPVAFPKMMLGIIIAFLVFFLWNSTRHIEKKYKKIS